MCESLIQAPSEQTSKGHSQLFLSFPRDFLGLPGGSKGSVGKSATSRRRFASTHCSLASFGC